MAQTDRQKAATIALEAAIVEASAAWAGPDNDGMVIVDWVVVAAEIKPDLQDPDGDRTGYSILMTGGGLPWYKAVGLLQAGAKILADPREDA